jgi:hypothetical protein
MAVRATMATLIAHARELINDSGATPTLTDQQVQDKLDLNRRDVYNMELRFPDIIDTEGNVVWKDFYSRYPFWEDGYTLQGPNWNEVTPTTAEPLIGRWTFAESQLTPVYITGRVYDMYGACAQLLTLVEGQLRCTMNFSADGLSVQRLDQLANIRELRASYRKQAWFRTVRMVRGDMR